MTQSSTLPSLQAPCPTPIDNISHARTHARVARVGANTRGVPCHCSQKCPHRDRHTPVSLARWHEEEPLVELRCVEARTRDGEPVPTQRDGFLTGTMII